MYPQPWQSGVGQFAQQQQQPQWPAGSEQQQPQQGASLPWQSQQQGSAQQAPGYIQPLPQAQTQQEIASVQSWGAPAQQAQQAPFHQSIAQQAAAVPGVKSWTGSVTQLLPPNYGIVDGDAYYITPVVVGQVPQGSRGEESSAWLKGRREVPAPDVPPPHRQAPQMPPLPA